MGNAVYGEPIKLEGIRGTFLNLAEPDTRGEFATDSYTFTCLVDKKDKANLKIIDAAICDVGGVDDVDDLKKHPLCDKEGNPRDGDDEDKEEYDGYAGCVYFQTRTSNQPELWDLTSGELVALTEEADIKKELYNGAYYDVVLTPAMYRPKQVTFYLNGVCKVGEGEKLAGGGGVATKNMFLAGLKGKSKKEVLPDKKKKTVSREEEEFEDEEEEEVVPKKGPRKGTTAKKTPARKPRDEEEEDEEEEAPVKRAAKKTARREEPEEEEEEEDEEEEALKKKLAAKKTSRREEPADEEEEEDEDEDEAPKKRPGTTGKTRKKKAGLSALLN